VAPHGKVRISLDINIAKSKILDSDIKEDMTGFAAELLGVQLRRSNLNLPSIPKQPTLPLLHSCLQRRQPLGFPWQSWIYRDIMISLDIVG
jgi:hypothetical protein